MVLSPCNNSLKSFSPKEDNNVNNTCSNENSLPEINLNNCEINVIIKKLTANTPIFNFNNKKEEENELELTNTTSSDSNETATPGSDDEYISSNSNSSGNNSGSKKYEKFIGIIVVFLITFTSTSCSELSQYTVNGYNSPLAIVWFNTLYLGISIVIEFILLKIELIKENRQRLKANFNNIIHPFESDDLAPTTTTTTTIVTTYYNNSVLQRFRSKFNIEINTNPENGEITTKGITLKKLAIVSIPMTILFISLNYAWMISLSMTEVSISTALYQSASVFCFVFAIIILREKIKLLKTISVVIFMAGVVGIAATTYDSSSKYPNAVKGDLLMILSAGLWALYEVFTSKFIGDVNRTVVHTYMGLMALINLFIGIPIIAIFNATNYELLIIPDAKLFGMLFLNGLVSFSLNYLIVWGLSITSPLFVRAGELLTIPATLVFDIVVKNMKLPLLAIPGYILIVIGFILSLYLEVKEIKEKESVLKQQQKQQ